MTAARPALPDGLTLPDEYSPVGPYLLHDRGTLIDAWRGWGIVTEDEWEHWSGPFGNGHRVGGGHVVRLYRLAGYLSWFGGIPTVRADGTPDDAGNINPGMIYKAWVSRPQRRRGLASAVLTFARRRHPHAMIRHSGSLTTDGKVWSTARP